MKFYFSVFLLKEPPRSSFLLTCVLMKIVKTNSFIWQGKYLLKNLNVLYCTFKVKYKNKTLEPVLIQLFSSANKQNKK